MIGIQELFLRERIFRVFNRGVDYFMFRPNKEGRFIIISNLNISFR